MKIMFWAGVLTLTVACNHSATPDALETSNDKVIRTAIANQVTNFYLRDSLQKNVWSFNLLFAQSLFVRSDNLELIPDLGASLTLTQPLQMKIALKNDALFQDGSPVQCSDVLWSFNDARHSASPYKSTFEQVDSWKCEKNSFHIMLKKPIYALVEKLLTGIRIYPANAYPKHSANPLGSGPYRLSQNTPDLSVWTKHDGYRGALKPWATKIVVYYVPDSRTRFEWLLSHKLDLLLDWPAEMDPLLKSNAQVLNVLSLSGSNLMALGFSMRSACFSKLESRRAVANIAAAELSGMADFQPSAYFKHNATSQSAKLTCTTKPRLYYPAQSPLSFYGAPVLQQLAKKLGIESTPQESSVFFAKLNSGVYDLFAINLPSEQEPTSLYEYLHSSQTPPQRNRFYFKNPQVDKNLEELTTTTDPSKIKMLLKNTANLVSTEIPFIPLGYANQKIVSDSNMIVKKSIANHPWLMMIEAVKKTP